MDNEQETSTHDFPGTFDIISKGYSIAYQETIDGQKTDVTIQVCGDKIQIHRKGASNVCFRFQNGKQFPTEYQTPYGTIGMNVITKKIENQLSDDGGNLSLFYILEMGGGETYHQMTLNVKKVQS